MPKACSTTSFLALKVFESRRYCVWMCWRAEGLNKPIVQKGGKNGQSTVKETIVKQKQQEPFVNCKFNLLFEFFFISWMVGLLFSSRQELGNNTATNIAATSEHATSITSIQSSIASGSFIITSLDPKFSCARTLVWASAFLSSMISGKWRGLQRRRKSNCTV